VGAQLPVLPRKRIHKSTSTPTCARALNHLAVRLQTMRRTLPEALSNLVKCRVVRFLQRLANGAIKGQLLELFRQEIGDADPGGLTLPLFKVPDEAVRTESAAPAFPA